VTSRPKEKDLDSALDKGFRSSPEFVDWFVSKTKFCDSGAQYHWSRSDNPWGNIAVDVDDPSTGETRTVNKQSETDVLVVLKTSSGSNVALHIENKLADGHFQDMQPELYAVRARQWIGLSKYQGYEDFETILIAPQAFYDRNREDAEKFDVYVSHEDIAAYITEFSQ